MMLPPIVKTTYANAVSFYQKGTDRPMWRTQVWPYLIVLFITFWILCAVLLLTSNYIFLVVLATLTLLSSVVVVLAWAYQNNI